MQTLKVKKEKVLKRKSQYALLLKEKAGNTIATVSVTNLYEDSLEEELNKWFKDSSLNKNAVIEEQILESELFSSFSGYSNLPFKLGHCFEKELPTINPDTNSGTANKEGVITSNQVRPTDYSLLTSTQQELFSFTFSPLNSEIEEYIDTKTTEQPVYVPTSIQPKSNLYDLKFNKQQVLSKLIVSLKLLAEVNGSKSYTNVTATNIDTTSPKPNMDTNICNSPKHTKNHPNVKSIALDSEGKKPKQNSVAVTIEYLAKAIQNRELKTSMQFEKAIKGHWKYKKGKNKHHLVEATKAAKGGNVNNPVKNFDLLVTNLEKILEKVDTANIQAS